MKAPLLNFVLHARNAEIQQTKQLYRPIQDTLIGPSAKLQVIIPVHE